MNKLKDDLALYVVSDRTWLGKRMLVDVMQECMEAGATFLQLREKDLDYQQFVKEAMDLQQLAKKYKIPFVVNDNIDVALAAGADGVHIGQSDGSVQEARSRMGHDKIVGVSAQTVKQALQAEAQGADYLGVGSMFCTTSKQDAMRVDVETLKEICSAVHIPVIAIGGIHQGNINELKDSDIVGVAIISAILASKDITKATKQMKAAWTAIHSS